MKRGNLPQLAKDGNSFNGSGRGDDDEADPPKRASAAMLAGRNHHDDKMRFASKRARRAALQPSTDASSGTPVPGAGAGPRVGDAVPGTLRGIMPATENVGSLLAGSHRQQGEALQQSGALAVSLPASGRGHLVGTPQKVATQAGAEGDAGADEWIALFDELWDSAGEGVTGGTEGAAQAKPEVHRDSLTALPGVAFAASEPPFRDWEWDFVVDDESSGGDLPLPAVLEEVGLQVESSDLEVVAKQQPIPHGLAEAMLLLAIREAGDSSDGDTKMKVADETDRVRQPKSRMGRSGGLSAPVASFQGFQSGSQAALFEAPKSFNFGAGGDAATAAAAAAAATGAAQSNASAPQNLFGSNTPAGSGFSFAPPTSQSFQFGGSAPQTSSQAPSQPFQFNSPAPQASSQPSQQAQNPFQFGSPAPQASNIFGNTSSANVFNPGQGQHITSASPLSQSQFASSNSANATFSSGSQNASTPAFSGTTASLFQKASQNQNQQQNSLFGNNNASQGFQFGTQNNAAAASQTPSHITDAPPTSAPANNVAAETAQQSSLFSRTEQSNEAAATPSLFPRAEQSSAAPTPSLFSSVKQSSAATSSPFSRVEQSAAAATPPLFSRAEQSGAVTTPSLFSHVEQSSAATPSLFARAEPKNNTAPSLFARAESNSNNTPSLFSRTEQSNPTPQFSFNASTQASATQSLFAAKAAATDGSSNSFGTPNPSSSANPAEKSNAHKVSDLFAAKAAEPQASAVEYTTSTPSGNQSTDLVAQAPEQQSGSSQIPSSIAGNTGQNSQKKAAMSAPQEVARTFDVNTVPPAPARFSEKQKFQWPHVWKLKVLAENFKRDLYDLSKGDNVAKASLISSFMNDAEEIKIALKRKQPSDAREPEHPSKRLDTGASKGISASQASAPSATQTAVGSSLSSKQTSTTPSSKPSAAPTSTKSLFGQVKAPIGAGVNSTPTTANLFSSVQKAAATAPKPVFSVPNSSQETPSTTPSLFGARKRKSDEDISKEDDGKKSRTGDVSYPELPAPAPGPPKFQPPKFQPPKFGSGTGSSNFLAQFGAQAKKTEKAEAEKRRDEDYDSEEETLEEWNKRDAEKRAAEKSRLEAISANANLGFKLKATSAPKPSLFGNTIPGPTASASSFTIKGAATTPKPGAVQGASVTDDDGLAGPKPAIDLRPDTTTPGAQVAGDDGLAGSRFESSKPAIDLRPDNTPSASLFGATPSAKTSKPSSDAPAQKPLFSFTPTSSQAPTKVGSLFASGPSVLPAAKPLPSTFSFSAAAPSTSTSSTSLFGTSLGASGNKMGSSLFGTSAATEKTPEPKGGLFDRVEKDKDGNFARESVQDNTFKGDSETPIKFSKSLPIPLASAVATGDTSRATTPATATDETEAGATGDDDTPKDEQLDLSNAAVGEEDEDVVMEVRSKASILVKGPDGKAEWKVEGVGQLKLLRNRTTKKTRILMRASPSAKIVLNSRLLPNVNYEATGTKKKTQIQFPLLDSEGKLQSHLIMVKEASEAAKLAALMEENKSN